MGERSSLVRNKNHRGAVGYSTFDPGGSLDSGLSISTTDDRTTGTDRERVSISWENIQAFVEQPGPSFLKRLCFGTDGNEKPTKKQVLLNGRCRKS